MSPARKEPDLSSYRGRFAARLKSLRENAGLSVEEAAGLLIDAGVVRSQNTIYNWEAALGLPKIVDFPAIAEVYGVKSPRNLLPEK